MIRGETVKVITREKQGENEFREEVFEEKTQTVTNVLVSPGAREDLPYSEHPSGVIVAYTLHFPKTFTGCLRGALVEVRGELFKVIGDPKPYTLANCPTRWHMPVSVESAHG